MYRRISAILLSALVMGALAANVALAAQPEGKGQPGSDDSGKLPGSPNDANAWGSVVTQTAIQSEGTFGEHASDPPGDEPRAGLGNVARNDQGDERTPDCFDPEGDGDCDTGDHVADHACIADSPFRADCRLEPGTTAPGR